MISPPIPRYTRASLRQVGVSSLTPLPYGVVVVETVALNPLVQGVTHTHTHLTGQCKLFQTFGSHKPIQNLFYLSVIGLLGEMHVCDTKADELVLGAPLGVTLRGGGSSNHILGRWRYKYST